MRALHHAFEIIQESQLDTQGTSSLNQAQDNHMRVNSGESVL